MARSVMRSVVGMLIERSFWRPFFWILHSVCNIFMKLDSVWKIMCSGNILVTFLKKRKHFPRANRVVYAAVKIEVRFRQTYFFEKNYQRIIHFFHLLNLYINVSKLSFWPYQSEPTNYVKSLNKQFWIFLFWRITETKFDSMSPPLRGQAKSSVISFNLILSFWNNVMLIVFFSSHSL